MPSVEALNDPRELRRCVRDLVALSTLPAIWKNYDPQQIADSVAAALVSMLNADFVHVALPGHRDVSLPQTQKSWPSTRESVDACW